MMNRHVFLIGMPGSGKSSIGRRVAANMHLDYIDTDDVLVNAFGMPTGAIFQQYGEAAFRNAELNLLIWLTYQKPMLVSTGGGMVVQPKSRAIMRNHGCIVLNDRPLEQITSDIKLDRRPLLASKGIQGVIDTYNARIDIYREAADITLNNTSGIYNAVQALERIIKSM